LIAPPKTVGRRSIYTNEKSMKFLRIITLSITLIALPAAGWGQVPDSVAAPEAMAPPAQVDEAELLVDRIRQTDSDLVQLIDQVATAEGESLYLLRSRIGALAGQQRGNLNALIELIAGSSGRPMDLTLLEQQGEQLLRRSSRRLRNYIQLFQTALEEEGTRRLTLTPGELQVFEHRMAEDTHRLNGFYLGLIQLTDQMNGLGLDTQEEEAFLERELTRRGQALLELVDLTKTRLGEFRSQLLTSPDDGDLQAQAFAAEERYDSNRASLLTTIHLMKTRGMDYVDLEVRAVEITGEITPDALEVDVAVGLLAREIQRARTYLAEHGPKLLLRGLVVVIILAVFWVLGRVTRKATHKIIDRTKISGSRLLKDTVVAMAGRLMLLVGLIFALSQMGIDLGPILAGLGIAGFIVGFALQDTLANFAAGAMILAYQPFDVGDFVEAAGVSGKVRDMNLVSTRILTADHQTLIVPNSKIWGDVIRNVTAQPQRRVDMVFGISYRDEIPKAERVLGEIVSAHGKVLKDPEPVIKVHTLNDSSVDFVVRPWARTDDYWDVYWDITREVKMRFDQEEISIPFPQRDVHLISQAEDALKGEHL
jgi:small conductance mechanosensitive channel